MAASSPLFKAADTFLGKHKPFVKLDQGWVYPKLVQEILTPRACMPPTLALPDSL